MTTAPVEVPATDVPRDRWGRPLIAPPGGGKPVAYTRASKFAGILDDTYNLEKWKQRQVAYGLSLRKDLQLRVVSIGPEPNKFTEEAEHKRWKRQLDEVCEAAMDAAGSSTAAITGTALHALTDRIDRGLDVGHVPPEYLPHLRAYEQATACLTAIHIERFVVCDELKVAGTFDRLVKLDGHDKLLIADTKSGNTEYVHKIAVQEAVYSRGQLYNHETQTRASLGDVDQDLALIIALHAGRGTCDLIWVNIAAGWEAAQGSRWALEWRRRRNLSRPYDGPRTTPTAAENARDLTAEARAALDVAIPQARSEDELDRLWRAAGNQWTEQHTAMARARMAELANPQPHLTLVG